MLKYFLKRLLFSIPTLLAISMVVFGILALAPGDPMGEFAANPAITEAVRENIRKSLGLDQPLPVRYVKWLLAFLQGDMGYSFTSRSPVFTLIWQRLPTTLWIVGIAYIFGVLIALAQKGSGKCQPTNAPTKTQNRVSNIFFSLLYSHRCNRNCCVYHCV